MNKQLIGLTGYAGSGKDEAAKGLIALGWERVAFADAVREMALAIDPMFWVGYESWHLKTFVANYGWDEAKKHSEVRRLLQRIGTEAGREILGEDIWVQVAERKIEAATGPVIVTDVRFPNEAAMIRRRGGKIVRIWRRGVGAVNGHLSESAIDGIYPDWNIANEETPADLHERLIDAVGMFERAIVDEATKK